MFTPLNYRLTQGELAFMLEDSGAHALFADRGCWQAAESVREAGRAGRPLFAIEPVAGAQATHDELIDEGPLRRPSK